jgi:serine/threonine protein kinase
MLTALRDRIEQPVRIAYHPRRCLGRGSRGSVWEARSSDGEPLALKFVVCDDDRTTSTLTWSLQALRQLAHPNIVHIDHVAAESGFIVIFMELADGSLMDMYRRHHSQFQQPLPAELVCDYLVQAAEALDFLNGHTPSRDGRRTAIQHGAVRPSNLLLFGDVLKLADCGPVWPTNVPLCFKHWGGSLDYAAPEVFRGCISDWTDQYALAVTYCQLRGGRLPFRDTPERWQRNYVRPMPDLAPLSEAEQAVIARALAPVPQDRWPSCGAMMRELEVAVADLV